MLAPTFPLVTERLLLRPYEVGDVPFILGLFGREDVCRYLNWEPMDVDRAGSLLERRLAQFRIEKEGQGIALSRSSRPRGARSASSS